MGLFGKRRGADEKSVARRRVELALPPGTTVSATDLEHLLGAWASGDTAGRRPYVLPAGLTWTGPRASTDDDGLEAGQWIYSLAWEPRPASDPGPSGDPRLMSELEAAIELASWLYDSARGDEDPAVGGPKDYAVAAVSGLARRTGGQVRLPGDDWAAPEDPEATWSVYVTDRPEASTVLATLHSSLHGLAEIAVGLPTWVLETPDGRGLWLEELDLEDARSWDDFGGPATVPVCALQALGSAALWAIRVEGADDVADADARADLDEIARLCAGALGGIAVDAEGFPVPPVD